MVAARETTLQELLEGAKQYQVPLYQRTYSWTKTQMQRLWDDIVKLAEDRLEDPATTHFIGSLVLAPSPTNGPAGVSEFLVVDGQQRLTTLSILLCAIRDHRARSEDPLHRARINEQYLINKWKDKQQRLKLLPTQADRVSYLACLDSAPQAGGSDPVGAAYRFFVAQLSAADDPDDPLDIERIEGAVISGLALVSVTAQHGDNVHRIFESLNNTGLKLTQGDLLRNYLFMRLPLRGEAVYQSLWLPLQGCLSSSELELLFWLDLVQKDARVKQTDIYAGQQVNLGRMRSEQEIEEEIARFGRLGALLRTVLHPEEEPDAQVRRRLKRLSEWGTTTVYPLLLHLLDRRDQKTATSEQIAQAMLYVESFLVRRLLIGRATNNINRILLSVVTEMSKERPVDEAVRAYLSTGRKYFGTDAAVRTSVRAIPYYLNGRPNQRSLVLQWLEESYGSKEPVALDSLTIEHVMPQTPTAEWQKALLEDLEADEEFTQAHEALVHTLGNLTLTGYNSKLSNSAFAVKRVQLGTSGIAMNQEISAQQRWGRTEILARADALADRIVTAWPGPDTAEPDIEPSVPWGVMNQALAELPAGSWTTYGDLAALIGSHAMPVGVRLATYAAPNAHRVLQVDGKVSPGFRWLDPASADDPQQLLQQEGVQFDEHGRADQAQRILTEELAQLAGIDPVDLPEPLPTPQGGQDATRRDRFLEQLADLQGAEVAHATLVVMNAWTDMGGRLWYGAATGETSCFLVARRPENDDNHGSIWPATLYPSGKFEIVFQRLTVRPPFDDIALREELRCRLNEIPGVNIAAARIALRPGFQLNLLVASEARDILLKHLDWFYQRVRLPGTASV
jgi:alkylated DNA nucleotide flippase Atl1